MKRESMKRLTMFFAVFMTMTMMTATGLAQMPTPAPEIKKLEAFAGTWTLDGDLKPGPMGPGGKITENETCEWMQGNFYLVCHTDFKGDMGGGTGISIMGYSTDDKAYTYREFNSWGEFTDSKGKLDGDTWSWTNDQKMGSTVMKARFTMKVASPTAYNFMFELSPDGTKWQTVMDGKATKAK
jgi:hypothetical protein